MKLLTPTSLLAALVGQICFAQTLPPALDPEPRAVEAQLEQIMGAEEGETPVKIPNKLKDPPIARAKPLARELDFIANARRSPEGRLLVSRGGKPEPLTINATLQDKLTALLRSYQTPYAAVVALEPSTGRVLAMAEHSETDPAMRGLCTKALYPAASIFKIITAKALLDEGLTPEASECFHGGKRRLTESLLADTQRDTQCYPLSTAMGKSANVVFAKMTHKYLSPQKLERAAESFRFNRSLEFPVPTEVSPAVIPADPFGLSSTGAGFGDVYLSPLHGAAIAAAAANGGRWQGPKLFESDCQGAPAAEERVMSEAHARQLNEMLAQTVLNGTARRVFRQRGYRVEGAVGKTGSLADRSPYRDYSWFVGFAPKHDPRIAVAAVIVNDMRWRIKATYVGREAMRLYLDGQPRAERGRKAPLRSVVKAAPRRR